ncbi:MAG: GNAT family N-acetyltransferase [Caldilineaceae bacterium]
MLLLVEAYWQELMSYATVVQDEERRASYFRERFPLDKPNQWALVEGQTVGFVSVALNPAHKRALVDDFYVLPAERRRGYGAAMVHALHQQLDNAGVELVELNVRRDNPSALTFWEAQGFRVARYLMR